MTNAIPLLLIFLAILSILSIFIIFLLKATSSAPQQKEEETEMKRQIKEEEDRLIRERFPYSMGGWSDQQDLANASGEIHSQAVAIVKARMKNKTVKKEAYQEKPLHAKTLPSSTITNSKTEKQKSQNQSQEIAAKNKVTPTKLGEKSIAQQIEEEKERLIRNINNEYLDYKELRYIESQAIKIVEERTKK